MLKLKYVVVFVALITQPINFAEVANAQLTGYYSSPQGYRTYYSVPGASYWHPVYTPRDNNQTSSESNNQISLRDREKRECVAKLAEYKELKRQPVMPVPAGSIVNFRFYELDNALRDQCKYTFDDLMVR